ncbi:hypothetical protein H0266_02270 [Halobacillus locisalis]|uniref:NlpC/P60 family protein n=1 Tax=Halobacillus locisalis TaxID=220753 RepID=A0A838CPP1_9BACI|nr:hypothetical protein [Halobacillus locisalis]MBA2173715.1 hypothetical protein [Halobacillus locisalis]
MRTTIEPTEIQILSWMETFVPNKDFFFLSKKHLRKFDKYIEEILIVPEKEFFQHAAYKQVQLVNSYAYWNLSDEVQLVMIAPPEWIESLPYPLKQELLTTQVEMKRGLVLSNFDSTVDREYQIREGDDHYLVLQKAMWSRFSYSTKKDLLLRYALLWDDFEACTPPENTPDLIKRYANSFPSEAGSNCLSTTLFALREQEWMIREWVHPETFRIQLQNTHVKKTDMNLKAGDVLVWEDHKGLLQHASYYLGEDKCFNKNGQTFFNPWKVVQAEDLFQKWDSYNRHVYRKLG